MAPPEAFSNLTHQSTPIRNLADRDESGRLDLDGILHSFDKSTTSLEKTTFPPFAKATLQIPQENNAVDITGDGVSGEDAQLPTTIGDIDNSVPEPQSDNANVSAEERSGFLPFRSIGILPKLLLLLYKLSQRTLHIRRPTLLLPQIM